MLNDFDEPIRNCNGILDNAVFKTYPANTVVLDETANDNNVYFILEGAVKVTSFSADGKEVWYNVLSAGRTVGEMAAISGEPRSANVTTTMKTKFAVLSQSNFIDLLNNDREVSMYFMQDIVKRLSDISRTVREMVSMNVDHRFSVELLRRTDANPDGNGEFPVNPWSSVVAVARQMNTKRETISRTISDYESRGIVRREGRKLFVVNRNALLNRDFQ